MGKVDSIAIANATINLIDAAGNIVLNGHTNQSGYCLFNVPDSLNSKLRIFTKPLGYNPFTSESLKFNNQPVLVKIIALDLNVTTLNEVKIFPKNIVNKGGTLIYTVKQDEFSTAMPTAQILTKVPGITIDPRGLKLFNKDNILILIDGKGEEKSQDAQLALLSSISADQIDRIEINSIPQARYNASVRGVVNIITKKQKSLSNISISLAQPFYQDDVNSGFDDIMPRATTNLNFTLGEVKASFFMGLNSYSDINKGLSEQSIFGRQYFNTSSNGTLKFYTLTPSLNLDYDINSRSSINLNFDLYVKPYQHSYSNIINTFVNYNTNTTDSIINTSGFGDYKNLDFEFDAKYKYLLNADKKSNLFINFIYDSNPTENTNSLAKQLGGGNKIYYDDLKNRENDFNFSIVFDGLIKTKYLSTEFGAKSNTVNYSSNYNTINYNVPPATFTYNEQLISLFLTTNLQLGKFTLKSDLRGEYLSSSGYALQSSNSQSLNISYAKLYPNFLIAENINDDLSWSIGYLKNIRRPPYRFLNPIVIAGSLYNTKSGNINFSPVYTDRVEVMFTYKDLVLTTFYEQTPNNNLDIPVNNSPFNTTVVNGENIKSFGLSASKSFDLNKWLGTSFNVDLAEVYYNYAIPVYYKNWTSFDIDASADIKLNENNRLSVDFFYNPRFIDAFSYTGNQGDSYISYQKLFLGKKLILNINVNDPFGLNKIYSRSYYPQFENYVQSLNNGRSISVRLVYKFPFGQKFKKQEYKTKNDGELRKGRL